MVCPKCHSSNVSVQAVTESQLKAKHRNILWWLFISWWWLPLKWIFLTIPALIVKIFAPKRQKIKTKHRTVCLCQNCGHRWNI